MRAKDIKIGGIYWTKVNQEVTLVKVLREASYQAPKWYWKPCWHVLILETKRKTIIKNPARFHRREK